MITTNDQQEMKLTDLACIVATSSWLVTLISAIVEAINSVSFAFCSENSVSGQFQNGGGDLDPKSFVPWRRKRKRRKAGLFTGTPAPQRGSAIFCIPPVRRTGPSCLSVDTNVPKPR